MGCYIGGDESVAFKYDVNFFCGLLVDQLKMVFSFLFLTNGAN